MVILAACKKVHNGSPCFHYAWQHEFRAGAAWFVGG